jgi:hypothetical protein
LPRGGLRSATAGGNDPRLRTWSTTRLYSLPMTPRLLRQPSGYRRFSSTNTGRSRT